MHGKEDINARIRDVLKDTSRLAAALEELNIPNFEIDQLRELGICPVQVGFTEEDALAFEPCFFLPQLPSTLLSDYPIREEDSDNESLLEEERELNSGISDSDPDSDYYGPWCIQDYSFGNQRSVNSHLRATRDGFDDEDVLEDFQVLRGMDESCLFWDFKVRDAGWRIHENGFHNEYPHGFFTLIHEGEGNDTSLSRGEVRSIVALLKRRCHLVTNWYPSYDTLPMLVISYLGQKGRIIQAHHDGQKLILQYSPRINFEEERYAAMSLFIRYITSYPVGSSVRTLSIR